jgi:uncharacterized protein YlzI (FlbEa/FlbD family)
MDIRTRPWGNSLGYEFMLNGNKIIVKLFKEDDINKFIAFIQKENVEIYYSTGVADTIEEAVENITNFKRKK